jgi:hypothetical protein
MIRYAPTFHVIVTRIIMDVNGLAKGNVNAI